VTPPGPLDNVQLGEALDFAAAACTILLDLQHQTGPDPDTGHLHPQLAEVADSHRAIHQATGMISVQAAVGLTDALLLLRAHAYSHERPLLAVAQDVVARIVAFAPEDDHRE
jgi:AmiR/NasT family two-component response regulator